MYRLTVIVCGSQFELFTGSRWDSRLATLLLPTTSLPCQRSILNRNRIATRQQPTNSSKDQRHILVGCLFRHPHPLPLHHPLRVHLVRLRVPHWRVPTHRRSQLRRTAVVMFLMVTSSREVAVRHVSIRWRHLVVRFRQTMSRTVLWRHRRGWGCGGCSGLSCQPIKWSDRQMSGRLATGGRRVSCVCVCVCVYIYIYIYIYICIYNGL